MCISEAVFLLFVSFCIQDVSDLYIFPKQNLFNFLKTEIYTTNQ